MQDAELFLELAAIAGVFVGFGALIAVRSGGASGAAELWMMRGMVGFAVVTVLAAVAPVTIARYDISDHEVWALSSVLVLVGWIGLAALQARTPEYRADVMARIERSSRLHTAMEMVALLGSTVVLLLILTVILLGLVPDLEAALYFTAVVLLLVGDSWFLLGLAFAQRRPAEA
jgi:hypothetical protein